MHSLLNAFWYKKHPLRWIVWPFSLIFQGISFIRRWFLTKFIAHHFPIPIIVVGNLTVGGVGKTPLVIALVEALQKKGWRVGVISRGYGGQLKQFPHTVTLDDNPQQTGDEPWLIFKRTGCPVVIAPNRVDAAHFLLKKFNSQIIISDDGLQHYKLGRAIEIVVIDGLRGLGNGMCLPAGPLREKAKRLKKADFIVVNQGSWPNAFSMELEAGKVTQILTHQPVALSQLAMPVAAVAGIGNPKRFFDMLTRLNITFKPYPFPDHYAFSPSDLPHDKVIIMTEKDAVKCQYFAQKNWYFLPISARLNESFWQEFWSHKTLKD